MKKLKLIFSLLFSVCLIGCASTQQSDRLLENNRQIRPQTKKLSDVPFIEQKTNHCGPATLAMVLQSYDKTTSPQDIAKQVYTPDANGSFQQDLISSARRNGMHAIVLNDLNELIQEVSQDHPVIVFQNLALTWMPQWHYAVVVGYDLPREKIILHTGPDSFKAIDFRDFELSWKLTDYWALVVMPPSHVAKSQSSKKHIRSAAAIEKVGLSTNAFKAYQAITNHWPKEYVAYFGMGNIKFKQKEYAASEAYFKKATELNPELYMAWHNLALVQSILGKRDSAQVSAAKAIQMAPEEFKSAFRSNLKSI